MVQVATQIIEPNERARIALNVLRLLDAAERTAGCETRLIGGKPTSEEIVFEQLEVLGHLLEPRRQAVGVLRAHCRQRAQDDQIECSLQQLNAALSFTGHSSRPIPHTISDAPLACPLENSSKMPGNEIAKMACRVAVTRIDPGS